MRLFLCTLLVCSLLGTPATAQSLDLTQYVHTAWYNTAWGASEFRELVQTPDGYLWGGTHPGVFRFDGVRFTRWQPPDGEKLPDEVIIALSVTRDGTLWIATRKGLFSWRDGKLTRHGDDAEVVSNVLERADGTIWFELRPRKLCTIRAQTVSCRDDALPEFPARLAEDGAGQLWMISRSGIWRGEPESPRPYSLPNGVKPRTAVVDTDGTLLILGDDNHLWRIAGEQIEPYSGIDYGELFPRSPNTPQDISPTRLFRSRDGALWIATQQGVLHVHDHKADRFTVADGLSGSLVLGFFEDRDSNVWVSTWQGIDRFHPVPVRTISRQQGLASSTVWAVQATPDGDVWISTDAGLNRVPAGTTRAVDTELRGPVYALGLNAQGRLVASTPAGLVTERGGHFTHLTGTPERPVIAIANDGDGTLWLSTSEGELLQRHADGRLQTMPITAPKKIPIIQDQDHVRSILPDGEGGLWLSFKGYGAAHLGAGHPSAAWVGLANPLFLAAHIEVGSDGALWVSTGSGVFRVKDGHISELSRSNGLPGIQVEWTIEDDDRALWVRQVARLARIDRTELEAGLNDPKRVVSMTIMSSPDGVRPYLLEHALSPSVTRSADGRIWFVGGDGVSVVDPRHLPPPLPPALPQIEQLSADGRIVRLYTATTGRIRLAALLKNLEIDFTAPTFTPSDKTRFRFKLDGQDPEWREVVDQRRAAYSNLAPGPYRFQVMAANASGEWSSNTAVLEFDVAPTFYQRRSFVVAMIALGVLLVGVAYRLRVRQVSRALSRRFDERLAERTRVAREIHDTFLQTVHGSKLVARHALKHRDDHDGVVRAIEQVSEWLDQATDEARSALNSLRASTTETNDLAEAFRRAGDDCPSTSGADISLSVNGEARELHPVVREEVYRIGYEAIRNACVHSNAARIAISLAYQHDLTLRVTDNGVGIDPAIIEKGKEGHFGLRGMKERAQRIDASLSIKSTTQTGTSIMLVVPGHVAFRPIPRSSNTIVQ